MTDVIELNELSLASLDFDPCCEMIHNKKECTKPAVALVKIKCNKCEVIADFFMCQEALEHCQKYGNGHPRCGIAWYVAHKAIK